MGELEKLISTQARVIDDPKLVEYIEHIVCEVAGPYCEDIRVYVVRESYFNASMAPNGMMLVNTGLFKRLL